MKAGLCERAEYYPYSTLSGLLGRGHLVIPVQEDQTLFSDVEGTLAWLNRVPDVENWEAVRKALRRKTFTLGQVDRNPHPLEFDTL